MDTRSPGRKPFAPPPPAITPPAILPQVVRPAPGAFVTETPRLRLPELTLEDLPFVARMLGDAEVMRFYPKALSLDEARVWLERRRARKFTALLFKERKKWSQDFPAPLLLMLFQSTQQYFTPPRPGTRR